MKLQEITSHRADYSDSMNAVQRFLADGAQELEDKFLNAFKEAGNFNFFVSKPNQNYLDEIEITNVITYPEGDREFTIELMSKFLKKKLEEEFNVKSVDASVFPAYEVEHGVFTVTFRFVVSAK